MIWKYEAPILCILEVLMPFLIHFPFRVCLFKVFKKYIYVEINTHKTYTVHMYTCVNVFHFLKCDFFHMFIYSYIMIFVISPAQIPSDNPYPVPWRLPSLCVQLEVSLRTCLQCPIPLAYLPNTYSSASLLDGDKVSVLESSSF